MQSTGREDNCTLTNAVSEVSNIIQNSLSPKVKLPVLTKSITDYLLSPLLSLLNFLLYYSIDLSVKAKLESIDVRGKLLNWFQNYLTDRTQAVVIKGEKSSEKKIPAGVPQGSVLGPLLFLIFINDSGHSIESIIKLFADDTSMSLGLTNPDTRAEILTCDLVKISDWAKLSKVKFNKEKTELVNIKRDTKPIHHLTFGNVVLEDKPHHKHLGITLQNNCKWDEHIGNISNKVNMLINWEQKHLK